MRARVLTVVGILCALFVGVVSAQTNDAPVPITASGDSPIAKANAATAREAALDKALISACMTQSQVLIPPALWTANQDIVLARLSVDPKPYIQDFRVLKEERSRDAMKLSVSAVPRVEKLRSDLVRWGILYDRTTRPRLGLQNLEKRAPGSRKGVPSSDWTRKVARRLVGLGFTVDELGSEARKSASPGTESHEIEITGALTFAGGKTVTGSLSGYRVKPPAELARAQGSFSLESGEDQAAGLMASALLENVLPAYFRSIGEGRDYRIILSGMKSYRQYSEVRDYLNSGRGGFSSAIEKAYAPSRATFAVVFNGSAAELGRALGLLALTEGRILVTAVTETEVAGEIR
ncbi:MAG: hypothetical protein V1495_01230 [Pseudomonadota bacterium]